MFPKKIIVALLEVCYSFSITMPYLPCTISQLANRPTSGQAAFLLWLVSWLGFCEPLFPTHVSQTRHGSRGKTASVRYQVLFMSIMKAHHHLVEQALSLLPHIRPVQTRTFFFQTSLLGQILGCQLLPRAAFVFPSPPSQLLQRLPKDVIFTQTLCTLK